MKSACLTQRFVSSALVFILLFLNMGPVSTFIKSAEARTDSAKAFSPASPAASPNENEELYDLVVLVVEKGLYEDNSVYDGLTGAYGGQFDNNLRGNNRMRDRVYRYADHIKNNNPLTDVKVILFDDSKDDVLTLAAALENFYRKGDGTRNNRLSGVVLIGDIPLPVVNKDGNRFISIFPYVDFSDKAYLYDPSTRSFEPNKDSTFPKPEIWHGIIRPPEADPDGIEKIAEFFDKNHLYYEDVPLFADFDQKLFLGDLVHKADHMNADFYARYMKYLDALEDLAYFRFNKYWAAELMEEIMEDFEDGLPINEDAAPAEFAEAVQSDDLFENIPDIMTQHIIRSSLMEYHEIFGGYFSRLNDFIDYTARYTTSDVHSIPLLIGIKDKFNKTYLRSVNDALEKSVNEVVSMIEEPLPLLEHAVLEGEFWSRNDAGRIIEVEPFEVEVDREGILGVIPQSSDSVYYRFHYTPDIPNRDPVMYVNGIVADIITSAKQCAPYLGSVNPDPSKHAILTRSIRSDAFMTSMPLVTSGVNTRVISPTELHARTGYAGRVNPQGIMETGAVIENNTQSGFPAFLHNPLHDDDYIGPFERELQEGDVITAVNGRSISYAHTFDQAIRDSYNAVNTIINIHNDEDLTPQEKIQRINNLPYPVKSIEVHSLDTLGIGEIDRAVGYIGIEYYRNGEKEKKHFSFTVDEDGFLGDEDPSGDARIFVLLDRPQLSVAMFGNPLFYGNLYRSDQPRPAGEPNKGSLFTLYGNDERGYDEEAYDSSAGCNAASTSRNSDRCFPMVATMPVFDPAGSTAPIAQTGKFPDRVKVTDDGANSVRPQDYEKNVEILQFPEGMPYTHVDRLYYNYCYAGLPSGPYPQFENNNFPFVLDPSTRSGSGNTYSIDMYGTLLKGFGDFIRGNLADAANYETDEEAQVSDFDPKNEIWKGLDKIDASQVVLNSDPLVTLKDFSDRYGLFDGIDNTGSGIRDYEWRDLNDDGVYETKFYDFAEASTDFGIPSQFVDEVARKMFSHESVYNVPFGFESFREQHGDKFNRDIVLKVTPHYYKDKTVSSMILHNEPTGHTLSEQFRSGTTKSLPIDNPRYVYFQSIPEPRDDPPAGSISPVNPREDFSHYYPGRGHRVDYINLFDSDKIPSFDNLKVELDKKAAELALIPGSYRIFGPDTQPGDYTLLQIKNEIYNNYFLPAISGARDNPPDGFDLEIASERKVYDALKWGALNIDEKHEYVLKYYLNASKNPYVGKADGYEAAYLVFDGEKDHFGLNFNLDLPEEQDPRFDPLMEFFTDEDEVVDDIVDDEEVVTPPPPEDDFESVPLWDFLKELIAFISGFSMSPAGTQDVCASSRPDDEDPGTGAPGIPEDELKIEISPTTVHSTEGAPFSVKVLSGSPESVTVSLSVEQNDENPPFAFSDADEKPLVDGVAVFGLVKTGHAGSATFSVEAPGLQSDSLEVIVTNRELRMHTYTYDEVEGMDELLEAIREQGETPEEEVFERQSSSFVADGESVMRVEVQVFDEDGALATGLNRSLRFSVEDVNVGKPVGEILSFVDGDVSRLADGTATISLRSGTKTGMFKLRADVLTRDGTSVDTSYPPVEAILYLEAGPPASLEIQADSHVLVANGKSSTDLKILIKDEFGNVADNDFSLISLFPERGLRLDSRLDLHRDIQGIQVPTLEGKAELELFSGDISGEASLVAVLTDFELEELLLDKDIADIDFEEHIGTSANFTLLDTVRIEGVVLDENFEETKSIPADGSSIARIGLSLMRGNEVLTQYSGPVNFRITNPSFGSFSAKPPSKMNEGSLNPANVTFRSSTVAGDVEIFVDAPGFASDTINFKTVAGDPARLRLGGDSTKIFAEILDRHGNRVTDGPDIEVSFKTTEATEGLIEFDSPSVTSSEGIAETGISLSPMSGKVNVIAEAQGLETATFSFDLAKQLTTRDVEEFSPRSLYVSLLGGAFGNVRDRGNLAQTLLFSGQVQALAAVTATPHDSKRLFGVDAFGHIEILEPLIETNAVPATSSFPYQKIAFSDGLSNTPLADLFLVPKSGTPLILLEEDEDPGEREGIYVKKLSPGGVPFDFDMNDDGVFVRSGESTKIHVDKFGRVTLNDDAFELSLPRSEHLLTGDFVLTVERAGTPVLSVIFKQNFNKDVISLPHDDARDSFPPGIYLKSVTSSSKYGFASSFSGISSNDPLGVYFVDTEETISPAQAPGFGFGSLENAKDIFGLGFDGDNKHMLLFAAGNSVGESHMPYPSESGLIFGDPLVRLKVDGDLVSNATGFSKDLGSPIFTGQDAPDYLITMDFNGNGFDDILIGHENGMVRLLENMISNQRFVDRGYVLHISNGITSMMRIDVNNNGFDDLLVGTEAPCTADEECVSLFMNNNGHFVREPLELSLDDRKIVKMMVADMDADGCEDVVLSDSSGNVSVHYNENVDGACAGIESSPGNTWNFGYSLDPDEDMASNLFVHYPGMETPTEENMHNFVSFVLQSDQPEEGSEGFADDATDFQDSILTNPEIASSTVPPLTFPRTFNFIHLPQDGNLLTSTKTARDIDGGTLQVGDQIEFIITLNNSGNLPINNLILSDATPPSLELQPESLTCMDIGCPDELEWQETGMSMRSHVIENISVPANGSRRIRYVMTVQQVAQIDFDVGKDFVEYPQPSAGPYLDIEIKPEINPDGILTYLYATSSRTYRRYDLDTSTLDTGVTRGEDFMDFEAASEFDPESEEVPDSMQYDLNQMVDEMHYDSNYSGYSDMIEGRASTGQAASLEDQIAGAVEGAIAGLRCGGGGCAPIPYNYAFLSPDGAIPGFPVLSVTPSPPFVLPPFTPSTVPSTFRMYLSPTLTLGVGIAACLGPSVGHASPCMAFALPGGIPGVCGALDATADRMGDAISKAKTASKGSSVNPATGMATIISDGDGTPSGTTDIDIGGNWSDPNHPISAGAKVNVKIPGFPAVITNWMDNQTDEIYNKLMNLPDLYLIIPDFSPWGEDLRQYRAAMDDVIVDPHRGDSDARGVWQNMSSFLAAIGQLPFVQIEGREVVMKVPSIPQGELERYAMLWQNLAVSLEAQLNDRFAIWNCDENEASRTICDKLSLDVKNFLNSINNLLALIDHLGNIPKDILSWRYAQAHYATQVICYMDAIMNYLGGWMKRQQRIADSWLLAAQDAIRTFKSWQAVLNVFADYQKSCDKCKSDRFSKLGLLMNIFVAVPEPPVIPMPKWPDIIVDVSKLRLGTRIIWPDIVFRPEPIKLPTPPDIRLPSVLPSVSMDFPDLALPDLELGDLTAFGLPSFPSYDSRAFDFAEFVMPVLPDLPPLPLPQLPDLPRPPKIPSLPNVVADVSQSLKVVFKILCLLKEGLIPIPESGLATEIETLTQPNVQAVLPIIKNLGFEMPQIKYDYIKEIRITAELNFHLDTNFIYQTVRSATKIWNDTLGNTTRLFEAYGRARIFPAHLLDNFFSSFDEALQSYIEETLGAVETTVEETVESVEDAVESVPDEPLRRSDKLNKDEYAPFFASIETLEKELDEIHNTLEDYIALMDFENLPETYHLSATETVLHEDHPLLNRTIAEIKTDIETQNLPDTPEFKQMIALRDSLIDYTDGIYDSNKVLREIEDINTFGKVLAEFDRENRKIASLISSSPLESTGGTEVLKTNLLGSSVESMMKDASSYIDPSRRIAGVVDFDARESMEASQGVDQPTPIGLYIASPDGSVNENVLMYTPALRKKNHVIYSDVDNDGDLDMIFASGGEIYLKENRLENVELPSGRVTRVLTGNTVSNYVNPGGVSIQNFNVTDINHNKADVSWLPRKEAANYEIILRNSAMHREENYAHRFLLEGNLSRKSLDVENGYYVATIYSIDDDGNRSLSSDNLAISPQICADTDPPFPAVSVSRFEIPIFQELEIDAGNSFDAHGEIVDFYLETVPYEKEGMKVTDLPRYIRNPDQTDPVFNIGPFVHEGDIGKREFILHVVDQSGNKGSMNIDVNVITPDISLDETFARNYIASGEVDPLTADIPFALMRLRYVYRVLDRELKLVRQLDRIRDSITDASGRYSLDDFELENMILVKNHAGQPVAEINPKTGNLRILVDGYSAIVRAASPPESPTRIDIVAPDNRILGTLYPIANSNSDVRIDKPSSMSVSVSVTDDTDNFEFASRPASDPRHPGAAVLVQVPTREVLTIVDASGNLIPLHGRISFALKDNDYKNDPLVVGILYGDDVVAEVTMPLPPREALLVGPDDVPFLSPRSPTFGTMNPLGTGIDWLFSRGASTDLKIIMNELYKEQPEIEIGPTDIVQRGEFVRVLLNMLCIVPRPEAYEEQTGRRLYWDGLELGPHYAYINEATMLGLVEGYRGEPDVDGLFPFRADSPITRAEAAKIIVEALAMKEIIDLSDFDEFDLGEGEPWYTPFMRVAQDLTPYVMEDYFMRTNFIVTPSEAETPDQEMTFEELVLMVERVLQIYSCIDEDDYDDLIPLDPSLFDPDADDCAVIPEIECRTEERGVYIVPAECNTCPCVSTFSFKPEVMQGDVFFPVILTDYEDRTHIFSKGNEVKIN